MSNFQISFSRIIFFGLFLIIGGAAAFAQSTLFNVPSTDTVEPGMKYLEADYITHFGSFKDGGFRSGGYRLVYGARRNVEVGANIFYTRSEGLAQTELQPNAKWRFYNSEKYKVAASGGILVSIPLNRQSGNRPFSLVYSNVSKQLNFKRGARLTGGGYRVFGAERDFGTKTGAIVGIEQPLIKRFTFVADWYSGNNRFGYSAAGINYQISGRQIFFAGYNFGNTGRANNSFSAFYGYTF